MKISDLLGDQLLNHCRNLSLEPQEVFLNFARHILVRFHGSFLESFAVKTPNGLALQRREAYARLVHLPAESAFDATDEEITEEMAELGEDLDDNADRLRAKMLAAAERGRKHRLKVLRNRWQRHAARIQDLDHGLPETPAARLDLLYMVVEAEPALRQQITVQHKDLKELDDDDVTRFLNQLAELGALDHFLDEGDDEE